MSYIIWGIAVFLLDVMTKLVAELKLMTVDTIPLWENVFHLTYVENRGIAFGLFSDQRLTFILVTFVLLFVLAVMFTRTENRSTWMRWGVTLIYGGALGNLVERMAKGYVVDFLDFRWIHFPVFNVADIAICVGAGLLMLHFLLTEGENNV